MPFKPRIVVVLVAALVPGLALATAAAAAQRTSAADVRETALRYVTDNPAELGVTRADVRELAVTSQYRSRHNGVTHVNVKSTS